MDTETPAGEVIWITGASTGIGRELCLRLAQRGHRVIASARNTTKLEDLVSEASAFTGVIEPLSFDVSDRLQDGATAKWLDEHCGYLDRVIINAGGCEYLDFPDPDWQSIDRVMAVNFSGAVATTQLALPLLRKCPTGQGHIVGVVSQVIFAPFYRSEAYGASKAAFDYFLKSLRLDLSSERISVSAVYPGFVTTPMIAKNDFDMPFVMPVSEAANRILTAMVRRPREIIFPKRLFWLLKLSKLFPSWWQKNTAPK